MNKNRILALVAFVLLLVSTISILQLEESPLSDLRMTLLGDRVQGASYGETALYDINIQNIGEYNRNLRLQLSGIPNYWDASLSKEYLILSGNSRTIVTLSVTAPSAHAAGARGLARVAEIGVRAGNVTIGTITILKGTATLLRNGTSSPLSTDDEILSGDIVTTRGSSVISLNVSRLFSNIGDAEGEIYLLLHNATVGFLRYEDTAYVWIMSGNVFIWVPGGGGTRAAPPLLLNLSEMAIINAEFPGREYNAVLTITRNFEGAFFSLNVTPDETSVEVYDGELEVSNDVDSLTLGRYERTSAKKTGIIPEPEPVERTIIVLESDGCVEGTVYYQGINVLELEDTYYLPVGNREYYITPHLPDLTLNLTGRTVGEYSITFITIEGYSAKSFALTSTGSLKTTDTFLFSENELKLRNMETGKTYDLTISYENVSTGFSSDFQAVGVRTSKEGQGFKVEDWEKLGDKEEKPVVISQGDKKVNVSTGITGEELDELLAPPEEEEPTVWLWISVFGILVLVAVIWGIVLWESKKE